jgi:hypothetical protein
MFEYYHTSFAGAIADLVALINTSLARWYPEE